MVLVFLQVTWRRLVSVVFARTDVCTPAMLILSDRKNPKTKYEFCRGTTNVSLSINNLRVSTHGDPLTNNLAFILRFVGVSICNILSITSRFGYY